VRAQPSRVAPPEEQGPQPAARVARARPRVDIGGFVEVQAGVSAELAGGDSLLGEDETLTYTSVAAGVEGQVSLAASPPASAIATSGGSS
jgi:hypothetical protein